MTSNLPGELFASYSDLLSYPDPALPSPVSRLIQLLQDQHREAADELAVFEQYIQQNPIERTEELYTITFDLQGSCCPYIGHHLFGESFKRSWFMSRLNEQYHNKGFFPGNELPDHLAVVLAFLALGEDDDFCQALIAEGLLPTLPMMIQSFGEKSENPYRRVLNALLLVLDELKANCEKSLDGIEIRRAGQ